MTSLNFVSPKKVVLKKGSPTRVLSANPKSPSTMNSKTISKVPTPANPLEEHKSPSKSPNLLNVKTQETVEGYTELVEGLA